MLHCPSPFTFICLAAITVGTATACWVVRSRVEDALVEGFTIGYQARAAEERGRREGLRPTATTHG